MSLVAMAHVDKNTNIIPIPKTDDRSALAIIDSLVKEHDFKYIRLNIAGIAHFETGSDQGTELEKYRSWCAEANGFQVKSIWVRTPEIDIGYVRDLEVEWSSHHGDAICIKHVDSVNRSIPKTLLDDRLAAVSYISAAFYRLADPAPKSIDSEFNRGLMMHHDGLMRELERTAKLLIDRADERDAALQTRYAARESELRDEHRQEQEALKNQINLKLADLKIKEDALDKKTSEIDDRDYRHARRANFEKITERFRELSSRPVVSRATRMQRLPVHVCVWAALLGLATGIWWFSSDARSVSNIGLYQYVIFLKPALMGVTAVVILTWYLKWMSRWFDQNSTAEIDQRLYELDVLRANWVVETSLEWPSVAAKDIPDTLVNGMTSGIFARRGNADLDGSPADYLASALLGSASKLKLNVASNELEFDRSGIKSASKETLGKKVEKEG